MENETNRFALIADEFEIDSKSASASAQAPGRTKEEIDADYKRSVLERPVGFRLPTPAPQPTKAVTMAVAAVATTTPPQQPTIPPAGFADWGNTGIDEEAASRAQAADTIATEAGLRFNEPTLFAWGTRMIGIGKQAHARARAELNAQPLLSTLAADASKLVASEARRGDVATLAQVSYSADDRLRTKAGSPGVPMGVQALKQLMVRSDAPGGGYLADARISGSLRAPHVTHWLDLHREGEKTALDAATKQNARIEAANRGKFGKDRVKLVDLPEPKRAKLLSKLDAKGERTLYGVVGPKYPHEYGMDAVIRDVMGKLPGVVRGSLFYDASTTKWRVDAALGTEFTPCVGDIHRVGLKFGSHDAGGGSYWASLYAIRVRCVNFTQINAGKKLGRVKHVGTVDGLQERLMALIDVGAEAVKAYSDLWAEANQTQIISDAEGQGGDTRAIFRALIEAGHLPAPDGRETAVEHYFNAWLMEPGTGTRADYVNAATRAAHEAPWSSPWATDEIEEAASQMVYQHVRINMSQIEVA